MPHDIGVDEGLKLLQSLDQSELVYLSQEAGRLQDLVKEAPTEFGSLGKIAAQLWFGVREAANQNLIQNTIEGGEGLSGDYNEIEKGIGLAIGNLQAICEILKKPKKTGSHQHQQQQQHRTQIEKQERLLTTNVVNLTRQVGKAKKSSEQYITRLLSRVRTAEIQEQLHGNKKLPGIHMQARGSSGKVGRMMAGNETNGEGLIVEAVMGANKFDILEAALTDNKMTSLSLCAKCKGQIVLP